MPGSNPKIDSIAHDRAVRGFKIHAVVFAIVNLLLILVNSIRTPQYFWAKWVLLDWGVGLATHAWLTFGSSAPSARTEQPESDE